MEAVDDNDDGDEKELKLELLQSNVCNIGAIDKRIRDLIYKNTIENLYMNLTRGSTRVADVSILNLIHNS